MLKFVIDGSDAVWKDLVRLLGFILNGWNAYMGFKSFWYYKRLFMVIDDTQRR